MRQLTNLFSFARPIISEQHLRRRSHKIWLSLSRNKGNYFKTEGIFSFFSINVNTCFNVRGQNFWMYLFLDKTCSFDKYTQIAKVGKTLSYTDETFTVF